MTDLLPTTPEPSSNNEFTKHLRSITLALDTLSTHAAQLPDKTDLVFHRTLHRQFAKELDESIQTVIKQAGRLHNLVHDGSRVSASEAVYRKFEEDDMVDGYRREIQGAVDGLLEDADSALDELSGRKKKAAITIPPAIAQSAREKVPNMQWISADVSQLPGPFSATLGPRIPDVFTPAKIRKPQLNFPDPVDNSLERPVFNPRQASKPHAMVPLDHDFETEPEPTNTDHVSKLSQHEREIRIQHHPYYYENHHLTYPESMFVSSPPVPALPMVDTEVEFVNTPEQLEAMVQVLKEAKEIGVDLEHHSTNSYYGFTSLLQISTREKDWIVDTLALRGELREGKLGNVLTDPSIIKVFHGADSDITWLQKDFDMFVVNLFDTYHATKLLEHSSNSLAGLLLRYCNYVTDKRYQMADWRIRPLPEEMLRYARSDTHFLLNIYDNLRNALLAKTQDEAYPQRAMREVLAFSAETALKVYEREGYDEVRGKGALGWSAHARRWLPKGTLDQEIGLVFRRLHAWRDDLARKTDNSPHYMVSTVILRNLAVRLPMGLQAVRNILGTRAPEINGRVEDILKIISAARAEWRRDPRASMPPPDLQPAIDPPAEAHIPAPSEEITSPSTTTEVDLFTSVRKAPPPTSMLFGTILNNVKEKLDPVKKQVSSLFGETLKPKSSPAGPSFSDVQRAVHAEFEPAPAPLLHPPASDTAPAPSTSVLPEPETVPFVPSASRTTKPRPENQPEPDVQQDSIVEVKRKYTKKQQVIQPELRDLTLSATSSAEIPTPEGTTADGRVKKPRTRRKAREPDSLEVGTSSGVSASLTPSHADVDIDMRNGVDAESELGSQSHPILPNDPSPHATRPSEPVERKTRKKRKAVQASNLASLTSTEPIDLTLDSAASQDANMEASVTGESASQPLLAETEERAPLSAKLAEDGRTEKKPRRAKVKAEDIPEFSYADEPNLLDNPSKVKSVRKEKKVKKAKPERADADFGRAPEDRSQPKEGNKSGTFA